MLLLLKGKSRHLGLGIKGETWAKIQQMQWFGDVKQDYYSLGSVTQISLKWHVFSGNFFRLPKMSRNPFVY
jgi:hypothetical protein